ncbi:hypothetical protein ACFY05_42135 [Microtetraspora fusca]|uniref:DUF4241 domain-containing protein n=1 Tax=Microtetraspora fusca TaxID=1997 RepID=A0ABW6VKG4_MICFU
MPAEFQVDEIVDITIKGARVTAVLSTGVVHATTDGGVFLAYVPRDKQVTTEHVAPAEWPPQPGDLWRDKNDELWFASDVTTPDDDPIVRLIPTYQGHEQYSPKEAWRHWGPMVLVHRDQAEAEAIAPCAYKAFHDDTCFGRYPSEREAQAACEERVHASIDPHHVDVVGFSWHQLAPDDPRHEMYVTVGGKQQGTGYVVVPDGVTSGQTDGSVR